MVKIVGIAQKDNDVLLYYTYKRGEYGFFKVVTSFEGFRFDGGSKFITVTDEKRREEKNYNWKDFRIAKQKDKYHLLYRLQSRGNSNLNSAVSLDLLQWTKTGKIPNIKEAGSIVPDYKNRNRYVMYFGEKAVHIAFSGNLKTWNTELTPLLMGRSGFFDESGIEVGSVLQTHDHILLIYYVKKGTKSSQNYEVGAALFDKKDPRKLLWRSDTPLWKTPENLNNEKVAPLGVAVLHDELILYWLFSEANVFAVSCPLPDKHTGLKDKIFSTLLKKFENNPIIKPHPHRPWESRATFNSAAIYEDGKVHFVYRALGDSDLSVLGYATSKDGIHIDERLDHPIYVPTEPFESPGQQVFKTFADHFASGGGYGGIEDPRITKIDDRFYMTYVAFDGANPPRVALTSIPVDDFLNRRFDKWAKPKLISPPGIVNKNAVIFPEKINGKYAVFHRVYPNILVDFVDDLEFDNYLQGQYFIPPRRTHWDSNKVGAGAPPIKTKDGWLFIYQAVGHQDPSRYKIGAMLLDSNDPTKVLYRANKPIIEPNEPYENEGFKAGVVYPCGAVVVKDNLFVYYGGADTVVCAASQDLNTFLKQLKNNQEPKLQRVQGPVIN